MGTNSTIGKIATAWMPIFIFFAQGFEHAVVNTLGNIVGGFVFTGLALYLTYKPRPTPELSPVPMLRRFPLNRLRGRGKGAPQLIPRRRPIKRRLPYVNLTDVLFA